MRSQLDYSGFAYDSAQVGLANIIYATYVCVTVVRTTLSGDDGTSLELSIPYIISDVTNRSLALLLVLDYWYGWGQDKTSQRAL